MSTTTIAVAVGNWTAGCVLVWEKTSDGWTSVEKLWGGPDFGPAVAMSDSGDLIVGGHLLVSCYQQHGHWTVIQQIRVDGKLDDRSRSLNDMMVHRIIIPDD